jgi:hypothetical protein
MISYCHENNSFCGEILDLLRTRNDAFEIWIDRTHCQEFIYPADSLKRRIVPIIIGNVEPKGWLGEYWIAFLTFSIFMYQLGIRMTGMKYIHFRDLHQLEKNKMTELLNSILPSLSSSTLVAPQNRSLSSQTVNHAMNTTSVSLISLDQQTSPGNDIHAWFAHHRISSQIRDLFDFQSTEEMLDYAELLIKDREKQMDIYARIFAQNYGNDMPPHECNRFANALERLLKEKRPSFTSSRLKSAMVEKSSTCVIL